MRQPDRTSSGADSGTVVVLDRFRSGRSLSPLRQAEAYWTALCDNGMVPRRSQIDPRGLANILSHAFILERVARRMARFRLAGDHLTGLTGMDMRGTPFTALFADDARSEAGAILRRVFAAPAVAELRLASPPRPGMPAVEGRMLLLPLATEDGEIARALGVLVADGAAIRPPLRFDIVNRLLRPVSGPALPGHEPKHTAEPRPASPPEHADGFQEARSGYSGRPPHLRLVK